VTPNRILLLVKFYFNDESHILFDMLDIIMLSVGTLNDAGDKRPGLLPPEKVL